MDDDQSDPMNIYGSGLPRKDWYLMRDAVLQSLYSGSNNIPDHLLDHPAAKAILEQDLDRAAKLLVPINPKHAWLALEKS